MQLSHLYVEPIQVVFDTPPTYEKSPPCPNAILWREHTFRITAMRSEWVDFSRRGRNARNMQPGHTTHAAQHGSWGVGRFNFEVEVEGGRVFAIYYDRAPKDAFNRKGGWYILGEV